MYYYGQEVYQTAWGISHDGVVEQEVLKMCNAVYRKPAQANYNWRLKSCVRQLYSLQYNVWRGNVLRQSNKRRHLTVLQLEKPKVAGIVTQAYKQTKTVFFVCKAAVWQKVKQNANNGFKNVVRNLTII